MGVGLSYAEVGLLQPDYPSFGQVFYVVDSDYRTGAQGWSKADRTGPLDLYEARKAGQGGVQYVFRSGDYTAPADVLAIQAAIDAVVDYRNDAVFLTPGNYSLATTALSVDKPNMRLLGPAVSHPKRAVVTLTDALGTHDITGDADNLEVAFIRFVPLTAQAFWQVATGSDRHHWHDFTYDANGITANVGTQLFLVDGSWDQSVLERFHFHTDGAQGPLIELDGTVEDLEIAYFTHCHNAGTLACSLLDVDGAGATGIRIREGIGQIGGGGAVTSLFEHADMTSNATNISVSRFYGSVGYAAAATLTPAASAAAEADYADSWLATVGGGAGGTLYIGTA